MIVELITNFLSLFGSNVVAVTSIVGRRSGFYGLSQQ